MKKSIKSFTFVLIAVILCFSTFTSVFASTNIPEATSDFYVNDFANVFSAEEKSTLMNNAVTLSDENDGIQVVISTVESLEGDTVENYAINMYNKYGIGKNDMGLLILLSTGDRQIRVEVGKAMEAYINDSKAGRFIDKYAIPHLKENKFNEGLINLQKALISEITTSVASESSTPANGSSAPIIDFSILFWVLGVILLIGLLIYIVYLIVKRIKKRKQHIADLNSEIVRLTAQQKSLKESHYSEISNLNSTIAHLENRNDKLISELRTVQKSFDVSTDRHRRILKIYPDADTKVDEMIKAELMEKDKKAASSVDSLISSVINLSPSKDIVDKLNAVITKYSSLTKAQKQYIKSDIKKLNTLYAASSKLKEDYEKALEEERIRKLTEQRKNKASSVTKEILAVIALVGIARANDLSKLKSAKRLYDDLDYETQKYVDDDTISKLDNLIADAKRDKDEEEEAERRRRQASYHSSSTFRSSSSSFRGGGFGGFGGRSGGGGASRGF